MESVKSSSAGEDKYDDSWFNMICIVSGANIREKSTDVDSALKKLLLHFDSQYYKSINWYNDGIIIKKLCVFYYNFRENV